MPFNASKRDQRDEQAYLTSILGDQIGRAEISRQRALTDACRFVQRTYGAHHLSISDRGLRLTLKSRDADGYGEAGSIHATGEFWIVYWRATDGRRFLRRGR
jgi:hypothetical protein